MTAEPKVNGDDLATAATQARTALSAPLRLSYGETRWRVPRWRIAPLLSLPSGGSTTVSISGRPAEQYLERLSATVSRKPQDAHFQVTATGAIVIRPSQPGLQLDVPATAKAIAAAAFSTDQRTANLVVRVADPKRTTEIAKTMGIKSVVSSYTTTYGGTPGRLNNVQLVAKLIDGSLIAPGGTFSFNDTTGERTAAKGFQEAPVIINGELQNGLGGGICQVSTTVFNAAFDAGLPITARTNHALYISHYPLGRDATVNYPDLDLRFSNDTDHWLLLRTFVGSGSLTVNLYGTPVHRRVESTTDPARRDRPDPGQGDRRPGSREGQAGDRRARLAAARDERAPARLRREREAPLRQHVAFVLRRRALARSRRHEGAAEEAGEAEEACRGRCDDDHADDDDAGGRHRDDRRIRPLRRRLSPSDRLHEPGRHARRLARRRVDRGVERLGGRHELAVPLDPVLVAEACSADVDAPQVDREDVVEDGRGPVVDPDSGRQRLDSLRLDRAIAAGVICQVRHAGHLEPDDERRVMGDALGVGLGEAHADVVRASESLRHNGNNTAAGRAAVV